MASNNNPLSDTVSHQYSLSTNRDIPKVLLKQKLGGSREMPQNSFFFPQLGGSLASGWTPWVKPSV